MDVKELFKELFVKMLDERQIIVIRARILDRKYPHYKIIGANGKGKWDFTRTVAEITKCAYIPVTGNEIAITGTIDIDGIISKAVSILHDERIDSAFFENNDDCGSLYSYCRDLICNFNA